MSRPGTLRIISLLPATTDVVAALGCEEWLVGRSHECDASEFVKNLPACTEPKYNPDGTSIEIDHRVNQLISEGLSVYRVDENLIKQLNPDLILTQDHCEVCAVSLDDIRNAIGENISDHCRLLSLSPKNLDEVWNSFEEIGVAMGVEQKARELVASVHTRLEKLKNATRNREPKRVATIEWIDPLMTAGNWTPELISTAGGDDLLAGDGAHSHKINIDQLRQADPDVILVIPCGYSLETTRAEMSVLHENPEWHNLRAVQNGNVALADGNLYFNRPGPKLVDSAEIIAEILHPEMVENSHYAQNRWEWWPG